MSENNKQGSDDWDSYRALVVDNFKRINKRLDEIETKFDELKDNHFHHLQLEMEALKVQINMYGIIVLLVLTQDLYLLQEFCIGIKIFY